MRKDPLLSFFPAWYFISLAPVPNFIPINAFLADRFLYLSSIGFIGFIAVLLNVRTIIRNRDWKNDLSLWSHESRTHPDNFNIHHLYAEALMRSQRFPEAKREYELAINLNPDYDYAHIGLGQTLVELGDLDKARTEFQTALKNTEKKEFVLFNLASLEEKAGNLSEVESAYLKAAGINNLALLYLKENLGLYNTSKAEEHAVRAVLLSGEQNSDFLYTQALAFLKLGKKASARASLQKALKLRPDFPPFLELLKKCR